jgi:hypothetical protein
MKEVKVVPKVAKTKVLKPAVKKATSKPRVISVSPKLAKPKVKKKPTRNFTLAQLSEISKQSTVAVKEEFESISAPIVMASVQSVQHNSLISYSFISAIQVIGMGLALFGICFAFVFGSGILPPHTQNAQVLDAIASTTDKTTDSVIQTLTCSNGFVVSNGVCVNPKPAVTFSVTGDPGNLRGTVPIKVMVENASRVVISVYSKEENTSLQLGPMSKTGDKSYTFEWKSTAFKDGKYYLLATVENAYGTYESGDTTHVLTVLNNPPVATTTQNSTSTPTTTNPPPQPIIMSNTNESATEFRLSVKVPNAQSVVMYAQPLPTGEPKPIGTAYKNSDTEWRYIWSLSGVPTGQYKVTAQVQLPDATMVQTTSIQLTKLANVEPVPVPTTTAATTSTTSKPLSVPNPTVTALVSPTSPLHGIAQFKIQVADATSVSLAVQNSNALTTTQLGKATKVDTNVWTASYDTTKLPDGNYTLLVMVTNSYGSYENQPIKFAVKNQVIQTPTPEQTKTVTTLSEVAKSTETTPVTQAPGSNKAVSGGSSSLVATTTRESVFTLVDAAIADELDKYAVTLRAGDTLKISGIKANIEPLAKQAVYHAIGTTEDAELLNAVHRHVEELLVRTESNVVTVDKIISDRTGEEASKDSDNDGIPDFDEVAVYKTNPFVSDTDNDGFIDGAEIMSGFDPLNAKTQSLVAYESPKAAGVEQKELLAITSVTTATPVTDVATSSGIEQKTAAIISGKAPANSYVTLFIFSTPIVITIKTDTDGGWNYHFDRELENGTHEVYVGVTDNAGKIVAKSAPFTFVKTAEAYTGQKEIANAVAAPAQKTQSSLLSSTMLYVLFGLSIVFIGLVLILIGAQLDVRRRHIVAS